MQWVPGTSPQLRDRRPSKKARMTASAKWALAAVAAIKMPPAAADENQARLRACGATGPMTPGQLVIAQPHRVKRAMMMSIPQLRKKKDSAEAPPRSCGPRKTPRDTRPTSPVVGTVPLASTPLEPTGEIGNIGYFYGNWGKRTGNKQGAVQRSIDNQPRKKIHDKSSASPNAKSRRRRY